MRVAAWLGLVVLLPLASGVPEIVSHPRLLEYPDGDFRLPHWRGLRHELTVGTPVYIVEDHTLPLAEIAVAVRAGAWLDPPDAVGLTSMTGAMVRRGGTVGVTPDLLDTRADALAAELDSASGATRAGASLGAPSWSWDESLGLFLEMLAEPAFDPDRLADARANLIESLRRRNDEARAVVDREWGWLLYGPDHYALRPMTPSSLDRSDREALTAFHRATWRPERMIVAVSGDVSTEAVLARLEAAFAAWPSPSPAEPPALGPPLLTPPRAEPGVYHLEHPARQAMVTIGHRTPRRSELPEEDRAPMLVLDELLGGGDAISRLAGRLRTAEGLVYTLESSLEAGWFEAGALKVSFATDPARVDRAVKIAVEELHRIQRELPHPLEVEVVKRGLETQLLMRFDTAEEVAGIFAEDELLGRPHDEWSSYRQRLRPVTPEDVVRVARRYLRPDDLVIVVGAPWEAAGAALKRLAEPRDVVRLPARDPSTLEPLTEAPGSRKSRGGWPSIAVE